MEETERRDVAGKPDNVCLSFTIPTLPPSSNSLYNVLFSQRRVELKPEARLWKSNAKECIPKWKVAEGARIKVSLEFCGAWYSKEGKMIKKDVTNREKLVLDAVCEKQGWDDSQVWERCVSKQVSLKEYVSVKLEVI